LSDVTPHPRLTHTTATRPTNARVNSTSTKRSTKSLRCSISGTSLRRRTSKYGPWKARHSCSATTTRQMSGHCKAALMVMICWRGPALNWSPLIPRRQRRSFAAPRLTRHRLTSTIYRQSILVALRTLKAERSAACEPPLIRPYRLKHEANRTAICSRCYKVSPAERGVEIVQRDFICKVRNRKP